MMWKLVSRSVSLPQVLRQVLAKEGHDIQSKLLQRNGLLRTVLPASVIPTANRSTKAGSEARSSPWDSILERDVFPHDRYRHVKDVNVVSYNVMADGRFLDVNWSDGHESRFHAIWLRHQCHCPNCRLPHTGRIQVDMERIDPEDLRLQSVVEDDGVMVLQWQDTKDLHNTHSGIIPAAFLRAQCYSDKAIAKRTEQQKMNFYEDRNFPVMDYNDIKDNEKNFYEWLKIISDRGLCLLKNVPPHINSVLNVGSMVGPIMRTWYEDSFEVQSHAKSDNPNFTSVRLFLHMDLLYYESPPGLQLLHCLKFDSETVGGESLLVDIFDVAERFRQERPEDFDALCRIPFTAETIHYNRDPPVHLQSTRPIFQTNRRGELISVIWHPMTFGALLVPFDDVEPFYKAYAAFFKAVQSHPFIYKTRLEPGDCICFNNRRVLHARNAFELKGGSRHLQGTYVEITAFQGRLQMLHNKLGEGQQAHRGGGFDHL